MRAGATFVLLGVAGYLAWTDGPFLVVLGLVGTAMVLVFTDFRT